MRGAIVIWSLRSYEIRNNTAVRGRYTALPHHCAEKRYQYRRHLLHVDHSVRFT